MDYSLKDKSKLFLAGINYDDYYGNDFESAIKKGAYFFWEKWNYEIGEEIGRVAIMEPNETDPDWMVVMGNNQYETDKDVPKKEFGGEYFTKK